MGDVTKFVIQPLVTLYGAPKSENVDQVFDLYEGILATYSDDVLKVAMQHVLGDFLPGKMFPWPAPALIKRAASAELAKTAKPVSTWPAHIDKPREEPTDEQKRRVAALLNDFKSGVAIKTLGHFDSAKVARSKTIASRIIGEGDE